MTAGRNIASPIETTFTNFAHRLGLENHMRACALPKAHR